MKTGTFAHLFGLASTSTLSPTYIEEYRPWLSGFFDPWNGNSEAGDCRVRGIRHGGLKYIDELTK